MCCCKSIFNMLVREISVLALSKCEILEPSNFYRSHPVWAIVMLMRN